MKNNINEQQIDYSADARLVINELEAVHPIFLLDEAPASYEKAKAEYIEYTSRAITRAEFRLAMRKFLAVLGDGHISVGLALNKNSLYIDIAWVANDGKLYLLDEANKLSDIEIINIGGVTVDKITEQVDIYNTAENESARQHNYALFCRQEDMLKLAGCNYTDSDIEIKMSDGQTKTYKLIQSDGFTIWLGSKPKYIIRHEMINDVFYIDLRTFQPDPSVDETAEKIKNAVQGGVKKFIIDVRDNSGGNSDVGDRLVQAMGMAAPNYGAFARNSDSVRKRRGNIGDGESDIFNPDLSRAVPNENIILLVLTNV
ncbi:MAG: S41 family peptidase, partial [Oscillospiraceae bacterium]|nr:S41 family peptidase [Oscillospiraceae bacterium]